MAAPRAPPGGLGRVPLAGPLAAGQAVEIKGVNGGIDARAGDGAEVEVSAVKNGPPQRPDAVKIEVVEHADGVTVCAVYPVAPTASPTSARPARAAA